MTMELSDSALPGTTEVVIPGMSAPDIFERLEAIANQENDDITRGLLIKLKNVDASLLDKRTLDLLSKALEGYDEAEMHLPGEVGNALVSIRGLLSNALRIIESNETVAASPRERLRTMIISIRSEELPDLPRSIEVLPSIADSALSELFDEERSQFARLAPDQQFLLLDVPQMREIIIRFVDQSTFQMSDDNVVTRIDLAATAFLSEIADLAEKLL